MFQYKRLGSKIIQKNPIELIPRQTSWRFPWELEVKNGKKENKRKNINF